MNFFIKLGNMLVLSMLPILSKAQLDISVFTSPTAWSLAYMLEDDTKYEASFFPSNKYGLNPILLDYLKIDIDAIETGGFVQKETPYGNLLFFREDSLTLRPFSILKSSQAYYLLYSNFSTAMCDCEEQTFLFIPEKRYLEKIRRHLFYSYEIDLYEIDLLKKLNAELAFDIDRKDVQDYCSLLKKLE